MFENLALQHATKQLMVDIADVVADQFSESHNEMAIPADGLMDEPRPAVTLALMLANLARTVTDMLTERGYARQHYRNLEMAIRQDAVPSVPADYTPDQRKMNGFYVDLQDGVVCRPSTITKLQAFWEVQALECAVSVTRSLDGTLRNQKAWDELIAKLPE